MQARVTAGCAHDRVRACGRVFDRAWRDVPASHEQDAVTNPDLDCRAGAVLIRGYPEEPTETDNP